MVGPVSTHAPATCRRALLLVFLAYLFVTPALAFTGVPPGPVRDLMLFAIEGDRVITNLGHDRIALDFTNGTREHRGWYTPSGTTCRSSPLPARASADGSHAMEYLQYHDGGICATRLAGFVVQRADGTTLFRVAPGTGAWKGIGWFGPGHAYVVDLAARTVTEVDLGDGSNKTTQLPSDWPDFPRDAAFATPALLPHHSSAGDGQVLVWHQASPTNLFQVDAPSLEIRPVEAPAGSVGTRFIAQRGAEVLVQAGGGMAVWNHTVDNWTTVFPTQGQPLWSPPLLLVYRPQVVDRFHGATRLDAGPIDGNVANEGQFPDGRRVLLVGRENATEALVFGVGGDLMHRFSLRPATPANEAAGVPSSLMCGGLLAFAAIGQAWRRRRA